MPLEAACTLLYAHLAPRLEGGGVVQNRLDLFPGQLMHEAHLVGVHEARIAHHVAAVGHVDGQHRAAAVGHRRGAVIVQLLVVVGADVAARKALFQVLEEGGVDGHHVFKVAVLGAVLDHQDLAVALDDLGLDLTHLLVEQHFLGQLAVQNLLADLGHALGTERVGGARPAQRRLLLLPALLQGLVGPFGRERWVGADAVQPLVNCPRALGRVDGGLLGVLDRLRHKSQSPP
jgi:hypothetical protein